MDTIHKLIHTYTALGYDRHLHEKFPILGLDEKDMTPEQKEERDDLLRAIIVGKKE